MFVHHVSWVSLLGGKFLHILSAQPLVANPGKKMNMMKASNSRNDLCSKKKQTVNSLLLFRMVRRNQVVDLYPFDKDEYQKGIEQAIMEVMETRRILQESIDDLIDEVPNPSEYTMEKLKKLKCH